MRPETLPSVGDKAAQPSGLDSQKGQKTSGIADLSDPRSWAESLSQEGKCIAFVCTDWGTVGRRAAATCAHSSVREHQWYRAFQNCPASTNGNSDASSIIIATGVFFGWWSRLRRQQCRPGGLPARGIQHQSAVVSRSTSISKKTCAARGSGTGLYTPTHGYGVMRRDPRERYRER